MVADMVAFVASQFTTSTWDVGAQELCSVVLIDFEIIMLDLTRWFVSWRCALRYPPPYSERNLPREGRIETGWGRHVADCSASARLFAFFAFLR